MALKHVLGLWLLLGVSPTLANPPPDPCHAPDELAGVVAALPQVAAVLKPGSQLEVLAVGSAKLPRAASDPAGTPPAPRPEPGDRGFPRQMARALQLAVPGARVRVTLRGGLGLTAGEMLDQIRAAVAERPYQLVIWQTGTVEAVRNTAPGEFAQTLLEGAEAVQAADADLVLVDPQFSRFLQTNSNLEPYEQVFQQLAAMPGVLLFRRFDLMRAWANDGQIDLERASRSDRKKMAETLNACLGAHLARLILAGTRL